MSMGLLIVTIYHLTLQFSFVASFGALFLFFASLLGSHSPLSSASFSAAAGNCYRQKSSKNPSVDGSQMKSVTNW